MYKEELGMSFAQEEKLASQDTVAFVACNGTVAGQKRLPDARPARKRLSGFARGECKSGRVGVGSRIEVCKQHAMSLVDGRIVIDKEKCDGCGDCAKRMSVRRV